MPEIGPIAERNYFTSIARNALTGATDQINDYVQALGGEDVFGALGDTSTTRIARGMLDAAKAFAIWVERDAHKARNKNIYLSENNKSVGSETLKLSACLTVANA